MRRPGGALYTVCSLASLATCLAAFSTAPLNAQATGFVQEAFKPETGIASWYGDKFHGRKTANGEIYDMLAMTAAHKTLPFGTLVLVTNLVDGRRVVVRINDRGPFIEGRIIDLSKAAAVLIGLDLSGLAHVKIQPAPAGTAVGPYPDPQLADAEARSAYVPAIIEPPATAALVVRIQVGSYRDLMNAGIAVENLASLGLKAVVEKAGVYHRVAVYVLPADRVNAESILDGAGWKDRLVKELRR